MNREKYSKIQLNCLLEKSFRFLHDLVYLEEIILWIYYCIYPCSYCLRVFPVFIESYAILLYDFFLNLKYHSCLVHVFKLLRAVLKAKQSYQPILSLFKNNTTTMLWKEDKRQNRLRVLLYGQREPEPLVLPLINYEHQYIQKFQFLLFIF